ncbi:hypothetical protein [Hungatella effluvii]|uniref:hypothetical protein n=1 Tax=Hungatella effluvii TaxID=1096246 RepID=UPI0022E01E15|nr:hypothetical protein [Hungatella effluvii]
MDSAAIVMYVFQTIITIMIGLVGWGVKNAISDLKSSNRKNAERIAEVEEKVNDLKADLPLIYVTREDYIRVMNKIEDKLDRILYSSGINTGGRDD